MIEIDKGVFRGPRPTDFATLKAAGIKTILSLQDGWFEVLRGKLYEGDESARLHGIELIHARLSDFRAPTDDQVMFCLAEMLRAENLPIYVHCKHGVDRTGFVCAAYRVIVQEWSIEMAIEEWVALGFHRSFYFWWPAVFRRLMREWTDDPIALK